jgi:hypothetical protein
MSPTLAALPLAWALALQAPPTTPAARCVRGAADACREVGRSLLLADPGAHGPAARLGVAHVTLACEMSDAPACADLGAFHAVGRGVAWDAGRAAALSRRACEGGVGAACSNWAVLEAEEAGGLATAAGARAAHELTRRFRTACDAGAPEGCLDLAAALTAGAAGGARDPDGAARALARGCDLGLGLACHRLALLRPDDARAGETRARACRAAIAPACEAAGLPVPAAGVGTPSPRLVEDVASLALAIPGGGGVHPADLAARPERRPAPSEPPATPAAIQARVPERLRARLGLDGAPGGAAPDAAVELLLPARKLELGQCLDVARAEPLAATRLAVAFVVEADGRAGAVRAAADPADPGVEACAAEVAAAWEFPAGDAPVGPFAVVMDLEPLPDGASPVYPGPSGLRPAPREPGCIEAAVRLPDGALTKSVTLKLAVTPDGRAALIHALTPVPEAVVAAVAEAARACRWTPGAGPGGRPAPVWTTVTVRVGSR